MEEIARSLPLVRRRSAGDVPTRAVLVGAARHIRQTAQMSTLSASIAGRSVAKIPDIQGLSTIPMFTARAILSASRRWSSVHADRRLKQVSIGCQARAGGEPQHVARSGFGSQGISPIARRSCAFAIRIPIDESTRSTCARMSSAWACSRSVVLTIPAWSCLRLTR